MTREKAAEIYVNAGMDTFAAIIAADRLAREECVEIVLGCATAQIAAAKIRATLEKRK